METFEGRTAVVTGGGSGIGRGIALALSDEGMRIVVADIQLATAKAVAEQINDAGGNATAVACDVTSEASLAELARAAVDRFGDIHVLSNNAGVIVPQGPVAEKSSDDWQFVFAVNLFGIVKSVDALLPALRAHGDGGHIVNTASMAGLVAIPELAIAIYGASKYACVAYSEYLRAELAPDSIGVSVLCPGMIESNLSATSAANRPDAFGGPEPAPEVPGLRADTPPPGADVMTGEECGRVVVGGIREDRLHIVTHPDSLPLVERRFQQLRDDYAAEATAQQARTHARDTRS